MNRAESFIKVVVVVSNKNWHEKNCLRRGQKEELEELLLISSNQLGYWSTYSLYRCPECLQEIKIDD